MSDTDFIVEDRPLPDEPAPEKSAPAAESQSDAAQPPETPAVPETEEQKNAKLKTGVEKRIGELTYRANQALREKQAVEAQARETAARLMEAEQRLAQLNAYANAPTLEQFNSPEEWQRAVLQHSIQAAQQQVQGTLQQAGLTPEQLQQRAMQAQVVQIADQRLAEASQKYPDIAEKVMDPNLPQFGSLNPAVRDALLTSPNFGDVAYFLASNPQEAWRLAQTHPVQAVMELGQLSARLGAAPPRVSNAPSPPRELGSSETVTRDPSGMSMAQYREWRKSRK
jgi:hypothetical protein